MVTGVSPRILGLVLAATVHAQVGLSQNAPAPVAITYLSGSATAAEGVALPQQTTVSFVETVPPVRFGEPDHNKIPPFGPTTPVGPPIALPVNSLTSAGPGAAADGPRAATDFTTFISTDYSSISGSHSDRTPEPSIGAHDQIVWTTGNWYAARSLDAGRTFTYVDPYTSFPSAYGGFCCDQTLLYQQSMDMIVWNLQYINNASGNIQRLAVAHGIDNQANGTFIYYDFSPQNHGYPAGDWFDFPDIGYGSNSLYMTTNVFTAANSFAGTTVFRFSLAELAAGGAVNYQYANQSVVGSYKVAQGLGTTGYFASHPSNSAVRILRWAEGSSSLTWDDVSVSAFQNGGASCPDPNGVNWCSSSNARIGAFWLGNGQLGAMWNSAQGGSFPYPYVQQAFFRETDRALLSQATIWNPGYAWQYPSAGVNSRGHVAGTISVGGGTAGFISNNGWIADDVNGQAFAPLENYGLVTGTASPSTPRWGDFFTTRNHSRFSNSWVTVAAAPTTGTTPTLYFEWMGRARDLPAFPTNDNCASPMTVTLASNTTVSVVDDNSYAVFSTSDPAVCAPAARTLWYTFTPSVSENLTIETCGGSAADTVLALWSGDACPSGSSLACSDDACNLQSRILNQAVTADQPYKVMVASYNGSAYSGGQYFGAPLTTFFTLTPSNLTPPTGVIASATTSTSVSITWNSVPAAISYRVYRSAGGAIFSLVGSPAGTSFTDTTASAGVAYLHKVRAFNGSIESGDSNVDLATTVIFTDPTLTPGVTRAKTLHITELRTAVNAVRILAGLSASSFTDPALSSTVKIKRLHVTELRTALDAARSALGLTTASYTDPTIAAGSTKIKAAHVNELRDGVR